MPRIAKIPSRQASALRFADNLPWVCVRDANGAYSSYISLYNVTNLPSVFLVNRNNELSARGENIKDLDEAIKKLL